MYRADGSDFAAQLADPSLHAVADFSADSDRLLILFGGIAGGVSMPPFEFFRVTGDYPVKRLYVRDPLRAWYLRGLPGVGTDAEALATAFRRAIEAARAGRVVMVGASAGGFAALLFGAWLGVDTVVAFSPQTTIGRADRSQLGDERWLDQIATVHAALGDEHPHYDVAPHLHQRPPQTRCEVHVSANDALDVAHGGRVRGIPQVTVREHRDGGHRLVKMLRDRGDLQQILVTALDVAISEVVSDNPRTVRPNR